MLARAGGLGVADIGVVSSARLVATASKGRDAAGVGASSTLAHGTTASTAEPAPTAATLVAPSAATAHTTIATAVTAYASVATTAASAD